MPVAAPVGRIISGGQTGVDRAALDVALARGIPCGGWVPRGRRAEDGPLDPRYPVRETAGADYVERTRLNVRDSDATLILADGVPTGGTGLTVVFARRAGRPHLVVDLEQEPDPAAARAWCREHGVAVLNVAGPRESGAPGIYGRARDFLERMLAPGDET